MPQSLCAGTALNLIERRGLARNGRNRRINVTVPNVIHTFSFAFLLLSFTSLLYVL